MGTVLSFRGGGRRPDKHSDAYKQARYDEVAEFRRVPPSVMLDILIGRKHNARKLGAKQLAMLDQPRGSVDGTYKTVVGAFVLRAIRANLEQLDKQIELLEQARALMRESDAEEVME